MTALPLIPKVAGFVAGRWTRPRGPGLLRVINPATGELLTETPDMGEGETVAAVEAAQKALAIPASLPQRKQWLEDIAGKLRGHQEELARLITLEQGKPLAESRTEVEYSAGFFSAFAGLLGRLESHALPGVIKGARWTLHHRPAGVAALITPWNFPLAMLAKKLPAALAAGCAAVIKPAERTPLSAMALVALCEEAGVPPGRVNLVIGRPEPIGRVLCGHPAVRLISFTGSTQTGQRLLRDAAPGVKRLALELGGNAPFLVFDDADPEAAVAGLMASKFRCAGQTCVCANRVYVQEKIAAAFTGLLADRVRNLKTGNGLEPGAQVGPLIHRAAFEKVARHVRDALDKGAALAAGHVPDPPENDWGCFFPPTVLTGAKPGMLVFEEETFGPVAAIAAFRSEAEVLASANGTPYGLAAYVFTRDAARAGRCAEQLVFGHVGVNTGAGPIPEAPFGGMKMSGFGREGGLEGLLEFSEIQTVAAA